ncbi:MAG: hypothetical protein ACRCYO_17370 [Bacteroidia bacterium]
MSKVILWTIKIAVILVVFVLMTLAPKIGIPTIVKNFVGFVIIFAVWKYNPDKPTDRNNNQKLDKS